MLSRSRGARRGSTVAVRACSAAFAVYSRGRAKKECRRKIYTRKGERKLLDVIVTLLIALAAAALGALGGYQYRKQAGEKKIGRTEEYAKNLLEEAQRKADEKKKETILEAKEEVLRLKTELDRECRERRAEVQRSERRIIQREESLDKKQDALEKREEGLGQKAAAKSSWPNWSALPA